MKKIKKLVAFLLAAGMILSLAACGEAGSTGTAPAEETGVKLPENDGPLTPYEETVTITTAVRSAAVQQFKDGDTYANNVWSRLIKEKLNINVEVAFEADGSTDAYNNQMNLLLTSGELPDVMYFENHIWLKQAYEGGYLADIREVYDEYATDRVKEWEKRYPDAFNGVTFDGGLYAYPAIVDNFHQGINLWIRDDWLENTNSEPPTTIDELIELARKFTFEDPDGNGVDDTYGLGVAGDVLQNNYGTLLGLFQAFGVPGFTSTGVFYRGDDNKMTFSYLNPNCKEALKVAKQMYDEGLIDPEFVVKDVSNMEPDVANGKVGMMFHACWGTWHPFNLSYQNDGVITRPYPIPTAEGYERRVGVNSNETGGFYAISKNCKNKEALIKILNLYEQVAMNGTDEEFKTYWADEQYRFCPILILVPTELFIYDVAEALNAGSGDALSGTALQNYNYVVGFEDGSLADDTNAYGAWGQLSSGGSMGIDLAYRDNGEMVVNALASEIPDVWAQNSSVLGDMVLQEFTDIITGVKPVDDFDNFVEQWLNAGGQETLDELDKLYPAE